MGQGFLIYYMMSTLIAQLMWSYQIEIPGYGDQESHIPLFGESVPGLILGAIVIVGIAPIVEEIFFRGYLYTVFKKYLPLSIASISSALLFAGIHMEFQVILPLFLLGLVLNLIFENTKSLWTPILFHMLNNALALSVEIALHYHWIEIPTL